MATLDELQLQLNALQQKVDAITAPPTDYYTQRYSGEETDRGVEIALGLDPDGTGIVTPEHGGTGASTPQAALAALGAGVRNNELDNPGLDINQRGQSSYDTSIASSYTVDRWWNIFGIYDVATKTMESTNQTYGFGFRQPINNPRRFAGKTVTLTAWILSGNGSIGIVKSTGLNSGLSAIGSIPINGPGLYSKTFNIPDDVGSDTYPYLLISAGASVGGSLQFASPIPFKLEFGEGQTLAYKNGNGDWQLLPQPNSKYSVQLLECQRYQLYYAPTVSEVAYVGVGLCQSTTQYRIMIPVPIKMRTRPTCSFSGSVYVVAHGQSIKVTGLQAMWSPEANTLVVFATVESGGVVGENAVLAVYGNQSGTLLINANL